MIAAWLSYGAEVASYMIAYNVGLALFILFYCRKYSSRPFVQLSSLGFSFFLCPGIPMAIVEKFIDFSTTFPMTIVGWLIKFLLSILLAWLITRYIEQPLIVWGKRTEKELK